MSVKILHKATIVTSEKEAVGSVVIMDESISDVIYAEASDFDWQISNILEKYPDAEIMELEGKYLMAGGIDAHVHFRDPGLTHKADIATESRAAVAGGVTSVLDMPNTSPATISAETLKAKLDSVQNRSLANIGFNIGATNENHDQIVAMLDGEAGLPPKMVGGVKVFMGSSTGNMLVDQTETLDKLFSIKERPVLVHCEDEATIKANMQAAVERFGDEIPFCEHENIRSRSACIKSSIKALEKAISHGTRLVLCHISTKEEIEMVRAAKLSNPSIIAETSCNYLWFCNEDYARLGSRAKCNPSIKTTKDRQALREALLNGQIDTIGSDHAPHLPCEKEGPYAKVPSGLPSIQQSLPVLLTIADQEDIPLTRIASVFSENASALYGIRRGCIRKGYAADIVIFDKDKEFIVKSEDQYSKCGWTPYEGECLKGFIEKVFVNGKAVVEDGKIMTDLDENTTYGKLLKFSEL